MSFVRSLARLRYRQPTAPSEWLIVGLGNPGGQYARTRHNIGFVALNRVARRASVKFRHSARDRADVAEAAIAGTGVLLAEPQTFMNDSGVAVVRLLKRVNLNADRLLLIYDDVDLPFGAIRIREEGSAGGHRGVKSVIDSLHTTSIARIRLGIGRGPAGTRDYVLAEFLPSERSELPAICDRAADIVEAIVAEGVIASMNRFNGLPAISASAVPAPGGSVGSQP